MNKIRVVDGKVLDNLDYITVNEKDCLISTIKIDIKKDTDLEIFYENTKEAKLYVEFNVDKNVCFNLFEYRTGDKVKIEYRYNLEEFSSVFVNKFYDADVRELDTINLNGIKAHIDYKLKIINSTESKYDMVVNHNFKDTFSNITNHAVNIDNSITINVTSIIPNNVVNCTANQYNRIINLTDNKCEIKPILLIDENDVSANHSALIGRFSDQEMFYLKSRGIDEATALNLLIKGFLTDLDISDELKDDIKKHIDKYWR